MKCNEVTEQIRMTVDNSLHCLQQQLFAIILLFIKSETSLLRFGMGITIFSPESQIFKKKS